MPKPMYVWSGSAWVSVATEVESLATYATQSYADNAATVASGSKLLTPTSIAVGSGSGSVGTSGTVTFSGASSVSLNGCFTSTYNMFLIALNVTGIASPGGNISFRYRVGGVDESGSNYLRNGLIQNWNNSTLTAANATSQTSLVFSDGATGVGSRPFGQIWVHNPATSNRNNFNFLTHGDAQFYVGGGELTNNTVYDGFTILSAGNMTGTVSVYGYRN